MTNEKLEIKAHNSALYPPNMYNQEFIEIYEKAKEHTLIDIESCYANYSIINYLEQNNIEGDIVECGVWKGGSSMVMAQTLIKRGNTKRKIYMYDTYEGMSEPTEHDINASRNRPASQMFSEMRESNIFMYGETNWCKSSLENVKSNMLKTNYPMDNIIFVKGKVEDTIPQVIPQKIAFLRLDTDWYESTKHELRYLYPLLVKNSACVIDDYYPWEGCRKAVDEYFETLEYKPLLLRIHCTATFLKP